MGLAVGAHEFHELFGREVEDAGAIATAAEISVGCYDGVASFCLSVLCLGIVFQIFVRTEDGVSYVEDMDGIDGHEVHHGYNAAAEGFLVKVVADAGKDICGVKDALGCDYCFHQSGIYSLKDNP